jgi:hypothetical protein
MISLPTLAVLAVTLEMEPKIMKLKFGEIFVYALIYSWIPLGVIWAILLLSGAHCSFG